ncbi:Membrane-bound lytic murein transglycosylase A [Olavius sp. associated proteobacterium Delta 1]|nr:Membrane-bound lytic murein transglycosylase A [Olavius sp. associated proteobacterium Delta 1]
MKLKYISFILAIVVCTALLVICVSGCTQPAQAPDEEAVMEPISNRSSPEFTDDMTYDGLAHSLQKSLSYLQKIPIDRPFAFGKDRYTTEHMIRSLQYFLDFVQSRPPADELDKFIRSNYLVYRSVGRNGKGEVLYTGYYEPHLRGSLSRGADYRFPIYARPRDLISIDLSLFREKYAGEKIIARYTDQKVLPYYDRSEIDSDGALEGNTEVLAWVEDPVDVFFLQIQGSGKVYLDNGDVLNVHYHTSNGRPYRSIGKLLIDKEKITVEEMSMQKIRQYLTHHPDEIEEVFNYNPSYVFFKIEPDGPLGNINVKLTPGRSIALDRRIFPKAALCFIETEMPVVDSAGQIQSWQRFTRFALNQDTGGAIRGPGRADIFWGSGPYAEIAAGHLKHTGKLYFLVLKPGS